MVDFIQRRFVQKNRLPSGGRINRNKVFTFRFNNKYYKGYEGDTLASALLANGVNVVGRSFKYSRARGIMTAGVEEPNAVVQLGSTEATQTPNVRATEQSLFDGLVSSSVKGWPNVNIDAMSLVGRVGGSVMGPGFYYKTFMFPAFMWETYEKFIRKAAGLGRSSRARDVDTYDHSSLTSKAKWAERCCINNETSTVALQPNGLQKSAKSWMQTRTLYG